MDTIKVLVADGDDASREGICLMLDDNHHTVAEARHSSQTLRLVATYCPQVVLLDVHLPDIGGARGGPPYQSRLAGGGNRHSDRVR